MINNNHEKASRLLYYFKIYKTTATSIIKITYTHFRSNSFLKHKAVTIRLN